MSSAAAFDVVKARLDAEWSDTSVVYENENFELPDTPEIFVRVEVYGDFFNQISIGGGDEADDNLWREAGQLLMHVMAPSGTGSRAARVIAKQLVDLFRGYESAGVEFLNASIGASDPGEQDGEYFRMTASVNWRRDE